MIEERTTEQEPSTSKLSRLWYIYHSPELGLYQPIIVGAKYLTGALIFSPATVIMHATNPSQTIGPNLDISNLSLSTPNPLAPPNISKRVIISRSHQSGGPTSRSLQSPLDISPTNMISEERRNPSCMTPTSLLLI